MTATCESCRFWTWQSEECRRYAPRPAHQSLLGLCLAVARISGNKEAIEIACDGSSNALYPSTGPSHWCGEHEPEAET